LLSQDVGSNSAPVFGQLYEEDEPLMISGSSAGPFRAYSFSNAGGMPEFEELEGAANPLNGLNVGYSSAPALGDLDGDGDSDLLSGSSTGLLHYVENTGDAQSPEFLQRVGAANPFDGVDV